MADHFVTNQKRTSHFKQLNYNWEDYDIIAFGAPVYVGEVSPVLKSYVESNPMENKNILIYAPGMAPEETKELVEMTSWVNSNNATVSIKITKDDGELLISFVKESICKHMPYNAYDR